jgi:uncharacterized protein
MTTVGNAAQRPGAPQAGLLARHPLVFFFLIAYAGSWLAWLPSVLSEDGAGLLPFSNPLTRPLIGGGSFLLIVGQFLGPFLVLQPHLALGRSAASVSDVI